MASFGGVMLPFVVLIRNHTGEPEKSCKLVIRYPC